MSTSMNMVEFTLLELGGVVVAAGYLLGTARRSRRAAVLGLGAVGLLTLSMVHWPRGLWVNAAELAAAYTLLLWAVQVDRPPPPDEDG